MRFFTSSRPRSAAPLSATLRGRRPSGADPDAPPARSTVTPTLVLLGVGVVLLAAALVIPSKAPSAVPTGALQPVVATTADLGATTPDDLWIETEAERAGLGEETGEAAAKSNGTTAKALEGSSSASVAGDDLTQAERAESRRRKGATEKRARERKAAKVRARAAAERAAERRRRARQRPSTAPSSAPARAVPPARSTAPTRPAAPVAAPAPPRTTTRTPSRHKQPSRSAVADEFTGGL